MATYARGKRWAEAGKDVKEIWNTGIQPVDKKFELVADFQMTGDQPAAVARLAEGVTNGATKQTMLGGEKVRMRVTL